MGEELAQATGNEQQGSSEGQLDQSGFSNPEGVVTEEVQSQTQNVISPEEAIAQMEAAQARAELYEQQNQFFQQALFQQMSKGQIQQNYVPDQSSALFEELRALQDGDFVAKEQVQKTVERLYSSLKSELQDQVVAITEYAAKQMYPDFDDVVTKYTADIVRQNPDMYKLIMSSKNPSDTAYKMGLTHPAYLQDKMSKTTKEMVNKVNQNIRHKPTLATQLGAQAGTPGYDANAVKSMSSEEFQKLVEQSKRGGPLPFK